MAVNLGITWSGVVELDPLFFAEVLELMTNELRTIIGDYLFWNAETAFNILPDEVLDFTVTDLMEGLSLNPLSEVIDDYEHVHPLAWGHWEFTDDVHPPFHERPGGDDGRKLLRWKMGHLCKALAAITFLDKGDGIKPHGKLVVSSR